MEYNPARLSTTFEKEKQQKIRTLLPRQDNIIRMASTPYLSRLAIEPRSPFLTEMFGSEFSNDRIKQMMGHRLRQIMEHCGYRLQQRNVKGTTSNNIFSRASRYTAIQEASQ